jgi:prophage DNA circulation protein
MSYLDEIRQAIYTSPKGQEFSLKFSESLSRTGGKKAPITEIPQASVPVIQDLGQLAVRYPFRCFIDGQEYTRTADALWDALNQPGESRLQHPRWGDLVVTPISISQTESFTESMGRAEFTIEFIAGDQSQVFPTSLLSPEDSITANQVQLFEGFQSDLEDVTTPVENVAEVKQGFLANVREINRQFRDTISGIDEVSASLNSQVSAIERNIDELVQTPALLISAVVTLIDTPSRIVTRIQSKIDGYKAIYTTLANSALNAGEFYANLLGFSLLGAVNSACLASSIGTIDTRNSASLSIDALASLDFYGVDSSVDSLQLTADSVAQGIKGLYAQTLVLSAETVKTLPSYVSPLEFVYLEDGNIDRIEEFILYNALQGDELFLMPPGKVVRWYRA